MSVQVSHEVLVAAIKASVIKNKQLSFIKKAKSGVVYLDFEKLCKAVKKTVPDAKDTSIRQRIYNVNAQLKKAGTPRQFKFPPVARKGRAKVDYASTYGFDI